MSSWIEASLFVLSVEGTIFPASHEDNVVLWTKHHSKTFECHKYFVKKNVLFLLLELLYHNYKHFFALLVYLF